jgi:hypothetical protein
MGVALAGYWGVMGFGSQPCARIAECAGEEFAEVQSSAQEAHFDVGTFVVGDEGFKGGAIAGFGQAQPFFFGGGFH